MQGNQHSVRQCQSLNIKRISYLITGYITAQLSVAESRELEEWLLPSIQNQLLFAELLLPYNIRFMDNAGIFTIKWKCFHPPVIIYFSLQWVLLILFSFAYSTRVNKNIFPPCSDVFVFSGYSYDGELSMSYLSTGWLARKKRDEFLEIISK